MGTYKGILGQTVQSLGSDITASAATEGQVWYNSSSNVWKMVGYNTGTWSSAPAMNTGRSNLIGSTQGTTSAMLVYGGPGPLNYQYTRYCEEYNGTSWTAQNILNVGRSAMGTCGTAAAAVANSGHNLTPGSGLLITELWNGTSWSNANNSNDVHKFCGGGGTQSAGIVAGGPGVNNEYFDGTTWTTQNDLPSPVSSNAMNGNQAEAYVAGGGPYSSATYDYDGTSWAASTAMSTGRTLPFLLGGNPNTDVVAGGGGDGPGSVTNVTEIWNGTSWSAGGAMSQARNDGGYGGTGTSGIAAGGAAADPGYRSETELWATGYAVQTLTTD